MKGEGGVQQEARMDLEARVSELSVELGSIRSPNRVVTAAAIRATITETVTARRC